MQRIQKSLHVQLMVIWAIMLRETKTRYGRSKMGYIWALIEPLVGISVFWLIYAVTGRNTIHGMHIPIVLLTGFGPWGLFTNIVQRSIASVSGNQALLTYPQVTPLDLVVARALLEIATFISAMLILLGIFAFYGYTAQISDLALILQSVAVLILFAFGLGLCLSCVAQYFSTVDKITGFVLRPLFFTSGIFFLTNYFPLWVQKLLLLNPVLNCIEFIRAGFFANYTPELATLHYPLALGLPLVFFGLLFERYTRKKITFA